MQSLMDQKIGSQVHYIPVVSHPFYRQMGFKPEDYPKALKYYQEALSIPIFNELTDNQQSFIISTLRSITS
jgi:dTDP-4-amino-4,6-dideoxygalactose transaminase